MSNDKPIFQKTTDDVNIDDLTGVVPKKRAEAFVNWSTKTNSGKTLTGSKGFPLFPEDAEYPNPEEQMLIAAAKQNGGSIELIMKVRVQLNTLVHGKNTNTVSVADLMG